MPDDGRLATVLRGDLAAMLRFAAGKKKPDVLSEGGVFGALLSQELLVAGTRCDRWHEFRSRLVFIGFDEVEDAEQLAA